MISLCANADVLRVMPSKAIEVGTSICVLLRFSHRYCNIGIDPGVGRKLVMALRWGCDSLMSGNDDCGRVRSQRVIQTVLDAARCI